IAARMEGVPELRKEQLLTLTAQVYAAAQKRALERAVGQDDSSPASPGVSRTSDKIEPAGVAALPGSERRSATVPEGNSEGAPGRARVIPADQTPPGRE